MTEELKPEGTLPQEVLPVDGATSQKSEGEVSSTPVGKSSDKVVFNGREYGSLAEAEKSYKELQTTYQQTKADKERLESELAGKPVEDDDFMKVLFDDPAPIPDQQVAPKPAVQQVDRDKVRMALLLAERDPKKPYFKEVANEVAKALTSDQMIMAIAGIGQVDKAVSIAYSNAIANRVDYFKATEFKRGQEEALRQAAKPVLAPADDAVVPPAPQKDIKDMTVEELEAFLPHAEPRA